MQKRLQKAVRKKPSASIISQFPLTQRSYHTIFKQSPVSTQIFAQDGMTIAVNRAWEKLWGIKEPLIVGKYNILKDKQLVTKGVMPYIKKAFKGEASKIPAIRYEPRQTVGDIGAVDYRILHASIYPVKDVKGTVQQVVLMHEDITDQMVIEENIKESEERYRTFIENSSEGIWRFELEKPLKVSASSKKQIVHFYKYAFLAECNDALAKMYGYKRASDIVGARLGDFLIESDRQNIAYLTAFIQSGYRLSGVESHEKDRHGKDKYFRNSLIGLVGNGYLLRAWGTQSDITNEKKAAAALRESEERFRLLVESSHIIPWESEAVSGKFTYVGPQAENILGYPLKEWYSTTFWVDHIHKDDRKWVYDYCLTSSQKTNQYEFEYRMITATGKTIWLRDVVSVLREDGKPKTLRGFMIDISETKQTQERLSRLAAIVESSDDAIISMNISGIIESWNKGAEQLYQYTAKEAVGKKVSILMPPHKKSDFTKIMHQLQKGKTVDHYETQRMAKDGAIFDISLTVSPIRNAKGGIVGASKIARDITQRKRTEKELLESETLYRSVIENSSDLISFVDEHANLLYISPSAKTILGYEPKELYRKNSLNIVHPEDHKKVTGEIVQVFDGRPHTITFRVRHKKGHYIVLEGVGRMMTNAGRSFILTTSRDITERLESEKRKDEFIGVASHELKTPVTSLKAYAQLLHKRFERLGDTDSAKQLEKMNTQLDKLTSLIGDLLDVTKIETGKLLFHEATFDLEQLVLEVIEEMQRMTDRHEIQFVGKGKSIYGDRERIGQVFVNFLTNAIKYSPKSDKIVVTLKQSSDTITCCVQDFGVGIPKEDKEKIFERFYRVSEVGQETYPGLGLGLFISSEIIRRHNGNIWVESERGKGSTFCFSLPAILRERRKKDKRF